MANTIMAFSKLLLPSPTAAPSAANHRPPLLPPTIRRLLPPPAMHLAAKAATFAASSAAALAAVAASPLPALAIEKAKLFDFNLTLPVIVGEFLLLMVFLDKIYYTPLGKFMDDRDDYVRRNIATAEEMTAKAKELEEQADAIMRAARAEVAAAMNKMRMETTAECEARLAEAKERIDKELAEAMVQLEKEREELLEALQPEIAELTDLIVKKLVNV